MGWDPSVRTPDVSENVRHTGDYRSSVNQHEMKPMPQELVAWLPPKPDKTLAPTFAKSMPRGRPRLHAAATAVQAASRFSAHLDMPRDRQGEQSSRNGSPMVATRRSRSVCERSLPGTRPPSYGDAPPRNLGWRERIASNIGTPNYAVPAGDYRDPAWLHHELQPMRQGAGVDANYLENGKRNMRHDVVGGDFRLAQGGGAMKQDAPPGYGQMWGLGKDGLWRNDAASSFTQNSWKLATPSPKHVPSGDYRAHLAHELSAMDVRDAPAINKHVVLEGDYRAHVDYDLKHPPVLTKTDPSAHTVKGGDYRAHANFGDPSRAPGGYKGE